MHEFFTKPATNLAWWKVTTPLCVRHDLKWVMCKEQCMLVLFLHQGAILCIWSFLSTDLYVRSHWCQKQSVCTSSDTQAISVSPSFFFFLIICWSRSIAYQLKQFLSYFTHKHHRFRCRVCFLVCFHTKRKLPASVWLVHLGAVKLLLF